MGLEVLAIDSGNEKRDLCLNKLGATAFIDFKTSKDLISDVKAATGGLGPHAVIVVASNTPLLLLSNSPILIILSKRKAVRRGVGIRPPPRYRSMRGSSTWCQSYCRCLLHGDAHD